MKCGYGFLIFEKVTFVPPLEPILNEGGPLLAPPLVQLFIIALGWGEVWYFTLEYWI